MRLNQFLAKYLGGSRRQADDIISNQNVEVNHAKAVLGQKIDPETDTVTVNGKIVESQKTIDQTLLFYKPIFCVCTASDPQDRKTIYDFIPKQFHNLKPAGRLDYMSEGLLVLSNNGDFLQSLMHPSGEKAKQYLVGLNRDLNPEFIEDATAGKVVIEDYQLNPVKVTLLDNLEEYRYLKLNPGLFWYVFELTEGRNNQIRKMCEMDGQRVVRLVRMSQGDFEISRELYEQKCLLV
jgi:pseudouridine synthase